LEQENPITKKAACEILNISYSTPRLAKIIEEYKEKLDYTERRRKQLKGTEIEGLELKDIVVSYLRGESIASISRRSFRSIHTIKSKLNALNLPEKSKNADYTNPELLPDAMVATSFDKGEYAWSAKYSCVAEIISGKAVHSNIDSYWLYSIYIFGKYMQFGYQPAYELGKLDILKQFKLNDNEFQTGTQDFNMRIV
jgi:hypothetical protein